MSRIESEPTVTTTSLPTVADVYWPPVIDSVSVKLKPLTVSEPSPAAYSIRLFAEFKLIESLPLPAFIVAYSPPVWSVSLSAPPEIETNAPVVVIRSPPPRAAIVTLYSLLL